VRATIVLRPNWKNSSNWTKPPNPAATTKEQCSRTFDQQWQARAPNDSSLSEGVIAQADDDRISGHGMMEAKDPQIVPFLCLRLERVSKLYPDGECACGDVHLGGESRATASAWWV